MNNRSYVLDILVAFLLITTIYFLVGQKNESEQLTKIASYNKEINQQNQDLLERVKSCTDPSGQCYKANTARSDGAVGGINTFTYCTTRPVNKTLDDVRKCVAEFKSK